ncbi:succinic semialdehyde dehydrogenase [Gephyromycinifex aptenodytis]|uniref:succinic semialdehyde dehydrogenase n=1 Tax=Gephyromycinifex aptenodytis TaxID=2716227 RepID=UPI0014463E8A|nr:succinic semialdehyde dehydrogenase [Gephyromycinifex aptenodytis]
MSTPPVVDDPVLALDPQWVAHLAERAVTQPRAETMTSITPLTGRPLAVLPVSTPQDVHLAFVGSRAAGQAWAHVPLATRSQVLLRFHDLLLRHQVEMLDLIQLETGKARHHAFDEIVDTAQVARHYARHASRYLRPRSHPGLIPVLTDVLELRHPKGVVGVVAPWNYPLSMGVTDALPALMAGNAVVVRPDPATSLTMLFAAELLDRAGLPGRVLQVVLGSGPSVGAAVVQEADHVCFTGSTRTGRTVGAQAGERLVSATLELGGKNPLYVAADADLDRAVEGAVRACFASAGQLCVSTERLLLHDVIADDFLAKFVPTVAAMRLGANLTYDADMGSLGGPEQLARVRRHVENAQAMGATVLTGARPRPDIGPFFYEPTVLTHVTPEMDVAKEETFGPVVSVYRVGSDAEAVALANEGEYGLSASVWTADAIRGRAIGSLIRAGSVNINEGYAAAYASPSAPMGGMGSSGVGRRHGAEGILAMTEAQTIATQRLIGVGAPARIGQERWADLITSGLKVMKTLGRH